uniref:Immunoglobulin superfamily member 10-like n=1 Tax=Phallusia mammillata TaxID=59560 RepID=A0A6F9DED1_9ASCI|nr:immunoglobulin superfamily member 10-like [Phallusia mammillata]
MISQQKTASFQRMEGLVCVLFLCLGLVLGFGGNFRRDLQTVCGVQCSSFSSPCTCYDDGWIDCKATGIEKVPAGLPECSRLLSLGGNRISEIGVLDLQGKRNVIEVNLYHNKLTRIDAGTFSDMSSVIKLNLSYNLISYVADCAFHGLTALVQLELQGNRIQTIGERAFDNMPSITSMLLFNNSISTFRPQWFDNKPNLTSVLDGGNAWNCTCQQKMAHTLLRSTSSIRTMCLPPFLHLADEFCFQCANPVALRGKSLRMSTLADFHDCPATEQTTTAPADPTTATNGQTTASATTQGSDLATGAPSSDGQIGYCSSLVQSKIAESKAQLPSTTTSSDEDTTVHDLVTTPEVTTREPETTSGRTEVTTLTSALPAVGLPVWGIVLVVLAVVFMLGLIAAILVLMVYRPGIGRTEHKSNGITSTGHTVVKVDGEMEALPTDNDL